LTVGSDKTGRGGDGTARGTFTMTATLDRRTAAPLLRTPKAYALFGMIALVLVVLWLLGVFAFHITTAAIHLILVIALILIVLHFVRGRRSI
jgi:Family of unknown function (DUF5670)